MIMMNSSSNQFQTAADRPISRKTSITISPKGVKLELIFHESWMKTTQEISYVIQQQQQKYWLKTSKTSKHVQYLLVLQKSLSHFKFLLHTKKRKEISFAVISKNFAALMSQSTSCFIPVKLSFPSFDKARLGLATCKHNNLIIGKIFKIFDLEKK